MKQKKNLWSDVSILIVAVLAVMAFLRGSWQFWALTTVFAVWSAWAICRHLIPFLKELRDNREARKVQKHYQKQAEQQKLFWDIDTSDPVSVVLLRHVNHRISAYLQASYPDATWSWCEENPEKLATKGGTGRIKLNNVPDFNFAEITLDQSAKIGCKLLKLVPLGAEKNPAAETLPEEKPAPTTEVNPQVWYEQKGKAVLTNLIVDLDSRGHSSLTIQEDGNIVIKQENRDIKKRVFETVPDRVSWPRLVKVFERDGIATEITDGGLLLSW
jgi:hypothetical protein